MIALSLFGILILLIFLGVPIALSLGGATMAVFLLFQPETSLIVLPQRMYTGSDSFVFMAVPFFMFAGQLMLKGGIASRLIKLAKVAFWWLPANLACVTTIASGFFGAISGSNAATVSAIGGMMVPAMKKDGYPPAVAGSIAAASGTLGSIIPPSIPMVVFGMTAGVSVTKLFLGGVVPGILLAIILCAISMVMCRKYNPSLQEIRQQMAADGDSFWLALKEASWALLMPVIILGGIYGGFFTPTEAAVVSVFYALFTSLFIYRELTIKEIYPLLVSAGISTGKIILVIAACSPFSWFMTTQRIPEMISSGVLAILNDKFLLILAMNLILVFLGCFLDQGVIILLVAPIFLPIADSIGMSGLVLGIIMVINGSIGMITPPMAVNLYIASQISRSKIEDICRAIMPYLIAEVIFIIILSNFPILIEWLPSLSK